MGQERKSNIDTAAGLTIISNIQNVDK
jgi:hypothetical protein